MFRRTLLTAALAAAFAGSASAATLHYTAHLTGRAEVPKTESKGTGTFVASYDTKTKQLSYTLTFQNLSGPATAAHLHGPATRKENAGVVAPLGGKNPTSPVSGTLTLTQDQANALRSHKLYVNVHTAANPAGEIRGQVMHASRKKAASTAAPPAASAPADTTTAAPAAAAPAATTKP
ncbi:MAG: hypothetical protein B7Z80_18750 [Rhodospirillales bacterium 20-64-7]|nr:MAG: hypothetical protein B7Z80_18750 [Rhodospirillales bacterium 20-64-7]HQT76383.1 CHRD domain-containing protein [Rhodopila sp.]